MRLVERCGHRAWTCGRGCPSECPGGPSWCGRKRKGGAHINTPRAKGTQSPSLGKSATCKGQTESQGREDEAKTPWLHLSITGNP